MSGAPGHPEKSISNTRITDGAVSPDGPVGVLADALQSFVCTARPILFAGDWGKRRAALTWHPAKRAQGEGVALGVDNAVFIVGEGGGKGPAQEQFARFACVAKEW